MPSTATFRHARTTRPLYGLVCLLPLLGAAPVQAEPPAAPLIRVAICDLSGKVKKTPGAIQRILTESAGFRCRRVTPGDIPAGGLRTFDVLIMPGGSARQQATRLGTRGRENIRTFVQNGGGYVGICAGSYLATTNYPWSLGIINARVVDRQHWARGTGTVRLKLTPDGQQALDAGSKEVRIHYGQGPLLAPGREHNLPPYEELAIYATEIARQGAPHGVMVGTTAIARARFGDGRVVRYSPHPEAAGGPHWLLSIGVRWAAGRGQLPSVRAQGGEIRPAGERLARVIDDMDVEHHWLPGLRIHWDTGSPVQPHRPFATHCSAFVAAACDRLGVYILRPPDHGQNLLANAQQKWLLTHGAERGWKEITAGDTVRRWQEAQQRANEGYVVVASYRNRNSHRPGHVALVRPSSKSDARIVGEGPDVAWAGRHNSSRGSLVDGFKSHPTDQVRFFYHRSSEQ